MIRAINREESTYSANQHLAADIEFMMVLTAVRSRTKEKYRHVYPASAVSTQCARSERGRALTVLHPHCTCYYLCCSGCIVGVNIRPDTKQIARETLSGKHTMEVYLTAIIYGNPVTRCPTERP